MKNLNSIKMVQRALEYEQSAPDRDARGALPRSSRRRGSGTTRRRETSPIAQQGVGAGLPLLSRPGPAAARARQGTRRPSARAAVPELPAARRERYRRQFGLTELEAGVLTSERGVADYFEAVTRASGRPKEASNWIQNELLAWVGDSELGLARFDELQLRPAELAEVIELVGKGTLQNQAARRLLREMAKSGRPAKALVAELGLEQVQDVARIEEWCRAALLGKERIIADVKAGKEQALNALLGPVMKASGGAANAQLVRETLKRLIAQLD